MPKGEILPTAPHCQDSRFTTKGKSVLLHPRDLILITCCCREEHSLFTEAKPLGCSWKDNCEHEHCTRRKEKALDCTRRIALRDGWPPGGPQSHLYLTCMMPWSHLCPTCISPHLPHPDLKAREGRLAEQLRRCESTISQQRWTWLLNEATTTDPTWIPPPRFHIHPKDMLPYYMHFQFWRSWMWRKFWRSSQIQRMKLDCVKAGKLLSALVGTTFSSWCGRVRTALAKCWGNKNRFRHMQLYRKHKVLKHLYELKEFATWSNIQHYDMDIYRQVRAWKHWYRFTDYSDYFKLMAETKGQLSWSCAAQTKALRKWAFNISAAKKVNSELRMDYMELYRAKMALHKWRWWFAVDMHMERHHTRRAFHKWAQWKRGNVVVHQAFEYCRGWIVYESFYHWRAFKVRRKVHRTKVHWDTENNMYSLLGHHS